MRDDRVGRQRAEEQLQHEGEQESGVARRQKDRRRRLARQSHRRAKREASSSLKTKPKSKAATVLCSTTTTICIRSNDYINSNNRACSSSLWAFKMYSQKIQSAARGKYFAERKSPTFGWLLSSRIPFAWLLLLTHLGVEKSASAAKKISRKTSSLSARRTLLLYYYINVPCSTPSTKDASH